MSRARDSSSGWAFQLASVAGIPIRVHFTFLLLIVWFAYESYRGGNSPLLAVMLLLLLFVCVVLHELGHAGMARRFGVRTREIVLYPIGGIARLERLPSGRAELWIALAGPAVNLAIAFLLFVALLATGAPKLPSGELLVARELPAWLWLLNVLLFGFNLLPAFPMDGGRVLRATLSLVMPQDRATEIATTIGQGISILFVIAGILTGKVLLVIVALFVFIGAAQEALFYRHRAVLAGKTARAAMITRFETLSPGDSLSKAADLLLATHQHDFPVIDAWGRVAGVLSRAMLFRGLTQLGPEAGVLEAMRREFAAARPTDDLDHVLDLLRSEPAGPVIVLGADERIQGMITIENVTEFVEVARRTAGEKADEAPPTE